MIYEKFKGRRIAIIGIGGTGAYILDQVTKTPVSKIHNNEDRLAQTLRPRAYLVFVFYYDIDSVFIYENIFDAVNTFKRKIDLMKYNTS